MKSEVHITLYLDDNPLELKDSRMDEVLELLPVPSQILRIGEQRLLLNGKMQSFPNLKDQITYRREFPGKNVGKNITNMLGFIRRNRKSIHHVVNELHWNAHLHVLIRTNFDFLRAVELPAEQLKLMGDLNIRLVFDPVHHNKK